MADNGFKVSKSINLNPQVSAPGNPVNGDIYYDSTLGSFVYRNGGAWASMDSIGELTVSAVLTSAQFTSGIVQNSMVRLVGSAGTVLVPGMTSSFSGKRLIIYNNSDDTVSFQHENGSEATANNRIITPSGGDMNLLVGEVATFIYDLAQNRWLLVSIATSGEQDVATTGTNGIVTLHKASSTPSAPTVLSDGDLNVAGGVVALNSSKTANWTAVAASNADALIVTGDGTGFGIRASAGGTGIGVSATGGNESSAGTGTGNIDDGGHGVEGVGGGGAAPLNCNGVKGWGGGNGSYGSSASTIVNAGVFGIGRGVGAGTYGVSGPVNDATGIYGEGSDGFDTRGVTALGKQAGTGLYATGGSTNGTGAQIFAGGNGVGLAVTGGAASGHGVTSVTNGSSNPFRGQASSNAYAAFCATTGGAEIPAAAEYAFSGTRTKHVHLSPLEFGYRNNFDLTSTYLINNNVTCTARGRIYLPAGCTVTAVEALIDTIGVSGTLNVKVHKQTKGAGNYTNTDISDQAQAAGVSMSWVSFTTTPTAIADDDWVFVELITASATASDYHIHGIRLTITMPVVGHSV